jgi:hypothetical protein
LKELRLDDSALADVAVGQPVRTAGTVRANGGCGIAWRRSACHEVMPVLRGTTPPMAAGRTVAGGRIEAPLLAVLLSVNC